jgi:hypothetical protein
MNPNSCWMWLTYKICQYIFLTYPEIVSLFISCVMDFRWMLFQPEYDKACFYFGEGSIFRLLHWWVHHVPKILVMGQSNASWKKKKKDWGHTSPIDWSMKTKVQLSRVQSHHDIHRMLKSAIGPYFPCLPLTQYIFSRKRWMMPRDKMSVLLQMLLVCNGH